MVQYSTIPPFNSDKTKMLVLEVANFSLYDLASGKRIGALAWLGDSSDPLWARGDPDRLYYHADHRIRSFNVATGEHSDVADFGGEYSEIDFKGEGDLSPSGKVAMVGDNREVFAFDIPGRVKGPVLKTAGREFDSLYITPDGNVLISWGVAGTERYTGVELFDQGMNFVRQVTTCVGHKDVGRDVDGAEIMVITDNVDNAVKKVRLGDGGPVVILPPLDWSLAVDVSLPDQAGFAIVSSYGKNRSGEILLVPLDPGAAKNIERHGSDSGSYDGQPKAAVSTDGRLIAWNSNMAGKVDVYIETVDPIPDPSPAERPGIDSQIVYTDARGGANLSIATFQGGRLVENRNLN